MAEKNNKKYPPKNEKRKGGYFDSEGNLHIEVDWDHPASQPNKAFHNPDEDEE